MRKFTTLLLMVMFSLALFGVSIHDIQYTTNATGASPLVNTVQTTEGIVTGIGFIGGKYVIADAAGAWNAIYVSDTAHTPALGDRISITGTVIENTDGQTEINTITAYSVISSGNIAPATTSIVPADLQTSNGEQYEAVMIKLTNVKTAGAPAGGYFSVAVDPSNLTDPKCYIYDGFLTPQPYAWSMVIVGQLWNEINGIVSYKGARFRVNPRSLTDLVRPAEITLKATTYYTNNEVAKGSVASVNIIVPKLIASWNITKYVFKVGFNSRILRFEGFDVDSTLTTANPEYELSPIGDSVTVTYETTTPIISTEDKQLVKLLFKVLSYGDCNITFDLDSSFFNNTLPVVLSTPCMIKVPIEKKIAWLSVYNSDTNTKNIFNPWMGQKITIEYGSLMQTNITPTPPAPKVIVRIYDVQGRLVATPINKNLVESDGIETLQWNGKDRNGNILQIGVYYCHFEMIDRSTGKSEKAVQPIVVAAELK